MSNPKPPAQMDPVTAELLALLRLLIVRAYPGASDVVDRIEALEQWRAQQAAVYPTINTGA